MSEGIGENNQIQTTEENINYDRTYTNVHIHAPCPRFVEQTKRRTTRKLIITLLPFEGVNAITGI